MRILVTGFNGYLMKHFIKRYKDEFSFIEYKQSVQDKIDKIDEMYDNIDILMHFASPSDSKDFENSYNMSKTMINGTINMVELANSLGATLIFASSEAVYNPQNTYGYYKHAMELYIKDISDDYKILRIPRVYSSDRNKGLIRKLKDNKFKGPKSLEIEYLDLELFLKQTYDKIISNKKIEIYNNKITESVKQIESRYIKGNK